MQSCEVPYSSKKLYKLLSVRTCLQIKRRNDNAHVYYGDSCLDTGSEKYLLHAGPVASTGVLVTDSRTCNSRALAFSASFRSYFLSGQYTTPLRTSNNYH